MNDPPRLYFIGSQLHRGSGNEFRLVNVTGTPILTHNMISSHRAFHQRKTAPSNSNIFKVQLANYIKSHIGNYPARATLTNFQQMINKILNKRTSEQARYRAQYNVMTQEMQENLLAAYHKRSLNLLTTPQNAERINRAYRNRQQVIVNTYINHHAMEKYRNHANQIIYWKWIKNSVLPELRTKFKNIRR
jgi:hypothetical protein